MSKGFLSEKKAERKMFGGVEEDYADYIDYFQTDNFKVMIETEKDALNNDGDEYRTDLGKVRYDIKKKIKVIVPKIK